MITSTRTRRGISTTTLLFALALVCAVIAPGCANPLAEYAGRVKAHVAPMKPLYEYGAEHYPGATDSDKVIYRRHWTDLQTLLDAPATQPAAAQ